VCGVGVLVVEGGGSVVARGVGVGSVNGVKVGSCFFCCKGWVSVQPVVKSVVIIIVKISVVVVGVRLNLFLNVVNLLFLNIVFILTRDGFFKV